MFGRHKPDTGRGKEKNATGRMITVIENFLTNIMPAPKIFRLLPIFYFFFFFLITNNDVFLLSLLSSFFLYLFAPSTRESVHRLVRHLPILFSLKRKLKKRNPLA